MRKGTTKERNWCLELQKPRLWDRESNGTPLQHSCMENRIDGGAWWAAVHGVAKSRTRLSDFTFTFHFHALEKEMATHSSVLAWRIPGTGEPGGLLSMGSHRVRHVWSDLAAEAADFGNTGVGNLEGEDFASLKFLPQLLNTYSKVTVVQKYDKTECVFWEQRRNWQFINEKLSLL